MCKSRNESEFKAIIVTPSCKVIYEDLDGSCITSDSAAEALGGLMQAAGWCESNVIEAFGKYYFDREEFLQDKNYDDEDDSCGCCGGDDDVDFETGYYDLIEELLNLERKFSRNENYVAKEELRKVLVKFGAVA